MSKNKNYTFKVWQNNRNKKWYWNATASNGEIVAASSQGFASKQSAIRNAAISGFKP